MHRIGLIGLGHWGPNIARSFELTGRARVTWLCDTDRKRLDTVAGRYADAKCTTDPETLLGDASLDAVAIATPVPTHHELATRALEAGKHVLLEKPITATSQQALDLIRVAELARRTLMVGHVFEYNSTILALGELIRSEELGKLHYLNFERTNLGPVRTDVNAMWDLAAHDVSILCNLLGRAPRDVTARGQCFLNPGIEDAVFATLSFQDGPLAHIHASWLNPRKVRQITVVGSERMVIWDDLDLQAPIRIFERRVDFPEDIFDTFLAHKTTVIDGGIVVPKVPVNAPLQAECDHFLDCLETGSVPRSDGVSGLRVVQALEAATRSMQNDSVVTPIEPVPR